MPKAATQARTTGSTAVAARRSPDRLASRPFAAPLEQARETRETESGEAKSVAALPAFSFGRLSVQRKLTVGRTDDPLEHEADRVADQVMRMPDPAPTIGPAPLQISRECADCEKEDEDKEKLQMKPAAASQPQTGEAPGIVHNVLRSAGQPLDPASRAYFEPRFGHDFSGVRVHTDGRAAESAVSIGASAYTAGSNIAFAEGRYSPATSPGRRLLAHELTHVVQQRALSPRAFSEAAPVQRFVGADVLTSTVTQAMAEAMTDDELMQQIQLLRSHLQDQPDDAGAAENLKTLEDVVRSRQAAAQTPAAPAPAEPPPTPATPAEATPAAATTAEATPTASTPAEAGPAEATTTPATSTAAAPAEATPAAAPPVTSASAPGVQTTDPNAAKPAPIGGVDVLSSTVTQATAEAMTDDELMQQIQLLRSHLQDQPDDAGARENLTTLESVVSSRQTTAQPPAEGTGGAQPPGEGTAAGCPAIDLDTIHKFMAAITSGIKQSPKAFGGQVEALLQPEALLEFAGWTIAFAALQATPAGWGADLAILGLEAYLIGPLIIQAAKDIVEFVNKTNDARDQCAIDQAGTAFADAAGIIGIALLVKLLFHESGSKPEPEGAPSGGVELKPAEETGPQKPPQETPTGEETPSEARKDQTTPDQESAGEEGIVDKADSVDGQRHLEITKDGVCEICASPCEDIRTKYSTELTENPDLAAKLDDASRLTDVKAQEAAYKDVEQKLADAKAAKGSGQGPAASGPATLDPSMAANARPAEQLTAKRLADGYPEFNGRTFKAPPPPDPGYDWADDLGRTYDAMGDGTKSNYFKLKQFTDSIDSHLLKGNNFTVIDATGYTSDQVAAIKQYVDGLPAAQQAAIRRVGF
jgi:ribosomal protein S15P/S13E